MTSKYSDIYSKFLGLIDGYDFLNMSETDAYQVMGEYLEGTFSKPKVRKLFSEFSWDDEIQTVDYTLRNSVNEQYDKGFFEFLAANGMVVGWLTPKVQNNQLLIDQVFGTKEQNFFSQANHITATKELLDSARSVLDKDYVRDHSYSYFAMNGELL